MMQSLDSYAACPSAASMPLSLYIGAAIRKLFEVVI